jgi:uncharacterized NAD(P)/FAD-binding protein YdhS
MEQREASIAIIGVGPYGLSVFERLSANAALANSPVRVHLIDPYLEVGGRVWRNDQPSRLWMNTVSRAITLFTDEATSCEGPILPGPTLHEWAAEQGRTLSHDESLGDIVDANSPLRWSSRNVMGDYLRFVLDRVRARPGLSVELHPTSALDVRACRDGDRPMEQVWLRDVDEPLVCDRVIFAQGHADVALTPEQARTRQRIIAGGGCYLPPGMVCWSEAESIEPGAPVLVRGLGLTFFDYLQVLTVGRGGAFGRDGRGVLRYRPSGKEPHLLATSRRGVTFRPSPWPRIIGLRACAIPHYLTADALAETLRRDEPDVAAARIATLAEHDVRHAYYAELFATHPDRVVLPWPEFSRRFLAIPVDAPERDDLIAEAVPAEQDRLDLLHLLDPLAGNDFDDLSALQSWLRSHIAHSANRSTDARFSADRAVHSVILTVAGLLDEAAPDVHTAREREILRRTRHWLSQLSAAMGRANAPWPRQEELIALSRAGVVTFLGPNPEITYDETSGAFHCRSRCVRDAPELPFTGIIEARLPLAAVGRSGDPLVRALHERGEFTVRSGQRGPAPDGTGRLRIDPSGRVVDANGEVGETRFAISTMAANSLPIILPSPRANSDFLLGTDRLARAVLRSLVAGAP